MSKKRGGIARYFQFKLKTLFFGMIILGVLVGWLGLKAGDAHVQRSAVEQLQNKGFSFGYRFNIDEDGDYVWPDAAIETLGRDAVGRIVSIRGEGAAVTHDDSRALAVFDDAEYLHLGEAQLNCPDLSFLRSMAKLVRLDLATTQVQDAWLTDVSALSKLDVLFLSDTPITDAGLAHLAGLEKLAVLHLDRTLVTGEGFRDARGLQRLQWLSMDETTLTAEGLAALGQLRSLESLDLSGARIPPGALRHLVNLPRLERLDLSNTTIGDGDLQWIVGFKSLKMLDLQDTDTTASAVKSLYQALNGDVYVSYHQFIDWYR